MGAGMAAQQRAHGGAGIPGRLGESPVPGRPAGTRVKQMAVPRAGTDGASVVAGGSSRLAGAVSAPLGGRGGAFAGGGRVDEAEMLFLMVKTLEESCPGAARALREEAEIKGLFGTTRDWTGSHQPHEGTYTHLFQNSLNSAE